MNAPGTRGAGAGGALARASDTSPSGRERILGAALALFGELGFAGTSVRQVAAAADVSAPLVLHHFGSKQGLRKAVDAEVMARVERALDAGLADLPADEGTLTARLLATQGQLVLDTGLRAHVRRSILEGGTAGDALLRRAWEVASKEVSTILASGRARPDLDVQETTLHLLLLIFGPWLLSGLDGLLEAPAYSPTGIERRLRASVGLVSHGILDR